MNSMRVRWRVGVELLEGALHRSAKAIAAIGNNPMIPLRVGKTPFQISLPLWNPTVALRNAIATPRKAILSPRDAIATPRKGILLPRDAIVSPSYPTILLRNPSILPKNGIVASLCCTTVPNNLTDSSLCCTTTPRNGILLPTDASATLIYPTVWLNKGIISIRNAIALSKPSYCLAKQGDYLEKESCCGAKRSDRHCKKPDSFAKECDRALQTILLSR